MLKMEWEWSENVHKIKIKISFLCSFCCFTEQSVDHNFGDGRIYGISSRSANVW